MPTFQMDETYSSSGRIGGTLEITESEVTFLTLSSYSTKRKLCLWCIHDVRRRRKQTEQIYMLRLWTILMFSYFHILCRRKPLLDAFTFKYKVV